MPLKASRRGLVPPFIVMDVMRAANARDAAARTPDEPMVIAMRSGDTVRP